MNFLADYDKKTLSKRLLTLVFFISATTVSVIAQPIYNYQDPVVFHTVMGSDKYYNTDKKGHFSLHLSPFYQHTDTANQPKVETKTTNGNIWGQWNMAGIFLNDAPRPATTGAYYATTKTFLANLARQTPTLPYSKNYTTETNFNPEENAFQALQYQNIAFKYEKMGLRGQLTFDLGLGLGISFKGGVVNMKQLPRYFTIQQDLANNTGITGVAQNSASSETTPASTTTPTTLTPTQQQATSIYETVMSPNGRRQLFNALGFNSSDVNITDLEDVYGSVFWQVPIKINEKDEHVFSVIPYLSIGASVPMGRDRNQKLLYPVINGNDGFTGLTAEGSIGLDFPNMMQLNFGGGATLFNTRDIPGVHVPTSELQSGIYPWTTKITKQPGPLWYLNVSMKADNIMSKKDIPNFSVYFDYIYAAHQKDSITIKDSTFAGAFRGDLLARDSAWKAQMLHAGLKFGLSKNVYLTFSAQSTIGGSRTYRPTTLLGGLVMDF